MIANKQIYSFIFIAFVAHIFAINFYPVNFEYSFAEASKFIKSYNLNILQDFFAHQANTITFSIFIGYINKILFFLNSYQVAKAISAASYLFIGMGLINLAKSHKIQNLNILILILFINPLIWTYAYRGTPDLISASLSFYGFTLAIVQRRLLVTIIGSLILGFAFIIKPISGIFILISFIYILLINKKDENYFHKIQHIFLISIFCFLFPFLYFILIWNNFGFLLLPPNEQIRTNWFNLNIIFYFKNLLLFLALSLIFTFPFSVLHIYKIYFNSKFFNKIILILLSLFIFYFGYMYLSNESEMGFGPFDNFINYKFKNGILALCSLYFCMCLISILKESFKNQINKQFKLILIIGILIYYFIMSSSVPAQRYIIIIFPLIIFLFYNNVKNNYINLISILFYFLINFLLLFNQYYVGITSNKVANFLIENQLINNTCPGVIEAHNGYLFNILNKNCKRDYNVVYGSRKDAVYSISQDIFPGKKLVYSVYYTK